MLELTVACIAGLILAAWEIYTLKRKVADLQQGCRLLSTAILEQNKIIKLLVNASHQHDGSKS